VGWIMSDMGDRIGLALSGGGFRATLFHLGVTRFLAETGLLTRVKLVSAVSGGSIFAAHLILNWEGYESVGTFEATANDLLKFVESDVRGQVLRRWLLGCSTLLPRFAISKERRWSLVNLLQRQYAGLFRTTAKDREATIGDLRRDGRPAVRFNCTSLTTGEPCYFDQAGFGWYREGVIEKPIPAFGLPVAYAVTASSAFPPLFPPVEISHLTIPCGRGVFGEDQRLTDGGVYDNLGIEGLVAKYEKGVSADEQDIPLDTLIISDAEGNFDSDFDTKYSFPVTRNVRASDLLMKRVSVLRLEEFQRQSVGTIGQGATPFVRVKIREWIRNLSDPTVLVPETQGALINVRTDLDRFSPEEVTALIAHGYSKAREALIDMKLVQPNAPRFTWDPLKNWSRVKGLAAKELQVSFQRKWRLWSADDRVSWATAAYGVFVFLLLATPTVVLALQSSIATQRAAEAAKAEVAARAAKDVAQAQAATAQAAKINAQMLVLGAAVSQIQGLMTSASTGCSGGPHGVPPEPGWPNLQPRGNNAVNSLNEAKLSLSRRQTSEALQQINSGQAELDAFVNGLHKSCSGGSSGEDPTSFGEYLKVRARIQDDLNQLKGSLAN
jgi:predicted acylesterase/phospholipase RssA